MQIQHAGRREKFSLRTPVKAAAAARARETYQTLIVKGWDEALREWKPQSVPLSRDASTIGDFLAELKEKADLKPKTLEGYSVALRKIVSDAFKIDGGKDKFDYRSGGRQRWLERVHAIKLAALTPDVVQKWKRAFLARAGDDPIRTRAAKISVNSFLRRAKSLFAPDATKHLSHVQLPSPLPFERVSFEPRQSMRYRSTIDVEKLTHARAQRTGRKRRTSFSRVLVGAWRWLAPHRDRSSGMERVPLERERHSNRANAALRRQDRALDWRRFN